MKCTFCALRRNPYFKGEKKTVEPWLLHQFDADFYGAELRLVLCGYIRPEADFTTLEALIAQIHGDADVARAALDLPPYAALRDDAFLRPEAASAR